MIDVQNRPNAYVRDVAGDCRAGSGTRSDRATLKSP
jgi:hypothetical protein